MKDRVLQQSHPSALGSLMSLVPGEVAFGVPLATLSRWRIGGPADAVVTPRSPESLAKVLGWLRARALPFVIVGDGSNMLFDDAGFRGVVLRVGRAFGTFEARSDGFVRAGAGVWVPSFVRRLIDRGLAGAVHAIGIPGTLGGLVVMNGGSQRRGIGEHVTAVEALDAQGRIVRFTREQLDFAYRASALQKNGAVVLSVEFRFGTADPRSLRREAIEILAGRRAKFPKVRANCGSVFVSDPKLYSLIGPPGLAIEKAGLKGLSRGDAQFSPDHANFIVNNGHARSADVLALVAEARCRVHALTGIAMDAEVRHLDPYGRVRPAHEVVVAATSQEMHDDRYRPSVA